MDKKYSASTLNILEYCKTALDAIDDCKTEGKTEQAQAVLEILQGQVGKLLENKDRSAAERDVKNAISSVSCVIESLEAALEEEHDIIFKVKSTMREYI